MEKAIIAIVSAIIGCLGTLLSTDLIISQNLKDTRIETYKEIILEFGDTDELWKLKSTPNEKWYRMLDYITVVSLTGNEEVKKNLEIYIVLLVLKNFLVNRLLKNRTTVTGKI